MRIPTGYCVVPASAVLVLFWLAAAATAKPTVEMEVLTEPGLGASTNAQQWSKALAEIGVSNVRFRAAERGERPEVKASGKGDRAEYRITAQMNSRGALVTPVGQFALSERVKLAKWIEVMTAAGPENLGQPKTVFGLTARQLEDVRKTLSAKVGFATKGVPAQKVLERLRNQSKLPLMVDPAIEQALAADEPVRDELQDVSLGTALAALARPAGAVLVPHAASGQIDLRLSAAKADGESWPIGWPPEAKKERDLIPMLFEFLNVEIKDVSATDAMTAIQGRLKVPFLLDHNNIVRHKIDLNKNVAIPAGKTYYKRIIDRLLFQVELKWETRVDEAGQPIVWITTIKK